jgi:FkbM family methyltransferase
MHKWISIFRRRRASPAEPIPTQQSIRNDKGSVRRLSFEGREFSVYGAGEFFRQLSDGPYSDPNTRVMLRYMPRGGTLIDVGANIGLVTLSLAAHAGHIHAIEPCDMTFEFLQKNVASLRNVTAHKLLIGQHNAKKTLFFNTGDPTGSMSTANHLDLSGHTYLVPSTCKTVSLDGFAHSFNRVDFLKIDTEGSEIEILKSAGETLARHKPSALIEFNAHTLMNFGDINPPHALEFIKEIWPYVYLVNRDASLSLVADNYTFMYEHVLKRGCVDDLLCSFTPLRAGL